MSKQERARQPATPGPCPRCGEWLDHECYWQHVGDAPGREGAWKLRHRKADGKVCRIRGGPAATAKPLGDPAEGLAGRALSMVD